MFLPEINLSVQNIFCIGRNYHDHIKELKNNILKKPIVFLKPTSSLSLSGNEITLPKESHNVHHELEVVVAIGKNTKNISVDNALSIISGYTVGIDVTARDLQDHAKANGEPWTLSKGFPSFSQVGHFRPLTQPISFWLTINGELRQKGSTDNLIFPIAELVSYLSHTFTLTAGDLIFTGTPGGVGPLNNNDKIEAGVDSLGVLLNATVRRVA